jgi:predicted TIM-barrel fold metal-dependent hydrolase
MMTANLSLDWLISVDDHILEPPNVWVDRVAAKDRDRAPRLVRDGKREYWFYDGKKLPTTGLSAVAGKSKEEFSPEPVTYDNMRRGCFDSVARLEDMNRAGILASLCFPSVTRFCGQLFYEASDREFGFTCIQAYNDWNIEEWCGSAPGRYIPLVLIPLWDPALAAKELERCAGKGATAFAFSENPAPLGLPTVFNKDRYWDPVMAAANDLEMVVCMHVGSSSQIPAISPESPFMANLTWGANRTSGALLSWLFSGMFQRFPKLKIALSEGEIGWIPYFLERAEQVINTQRHWVKRGVKMYEHASTDVDIDQIDIYGDFREHVFGCFIDDAHGIRSLDEIGEDNVMCETDYPHSDSTWPNCLTVVKNRIGHLPEPTQYKLLRGNAERVFRFTPAEPPVSAASANA